MDILLLLLALAFLADSGKKRELPERGTGIKTGRAGERRAGKPRTEAERRERHYAVR